ncbi:hypothetical protein [Labrys sp. (in: a-proteobacteria)]|uniref:hypothetical protein n=1 Tax=Labrys sp. (in: a-proteobacteria) TaxID=1917972 RepID=UPI0039E5E4E5
MIVARVISGAGKHFQSRFWEWLHTGMLFGASYAISQSDATFQLSPAYMFMRSLAFDGFWVAAFAVIAMLRFVALTLNGTFELFRRYSPLVRCILAALSALCWASIAIGLLQAEQSRLGLVTFVGLTWGELFLFMKVAEEAGDIERGYRNGSA